MPRRASNTLNKSPKLLFWETDLAAAAAAAARFTKYNNNDKHKKSLLKRS